MSRENVEVVRKLYEAAVRRDADTVVSLYDEEVELDFSRIPHAQLSGRGVYHGHDGLRSWYREWNDAWESFEQVYEELIDAGEQVVSVSSQRGQGRLSGAEVELRHQAAVWTIREGKVVRLVAFPSREEALEAVGLRD
jgi:ketosteroid isomerase-like protein